MIATVRRWSGEIAQRARSWRWWVRDAAVESVAPASTSTLLHDAEWSKWSNQEIARRCGVSPHTVADLRPAAVTLQTQSEKPSRTYTTKHGTEATISAWRAAEGLRASPWRVRDLVASRALACSLGAAIPYSGSRRARVLLRRLSVNAEALRGLLDEGGR